MLLVSAAAASLADVAAAAIGERDDDGTVAEYCALQYYMLIRFTNSPG